jgi:hypothetical protein
VSGTIETPVPISGERGSRWLVIGLLTGALVVGAAVLTVVLATSGSGDPFAPGTGSATITWTSVSGSESSAAPPPQPFGGTIDGSPVAGVATMNTSAFSGAFGRPLGTAPVTIRLFDYAGMFDSKHFELGLLVRLSSAILLPQNARIPVAEVRGSYGSEPVQAQITVPVPGTAHKPSTTASFHGTIGTLRVSGTVSGPTRTGSHNRATATFTVAK